MVDHNPKSGALFQNEVTKPLPDQTSGREARILVFSPTGVTAYPLNPSRTSIGRADESDIRIDDPALSRVHAEIGFDPTQGALGLTLRDLNSSNGTRLRGRVTSANNAHPFLPGDLIDVGQCSITVQLNERTSETTDLTPHLEAALGDASPFGLLIAETPETQPSLEGVVAALAGPTDQRGALGAQRYGLILREVSDQGLEDAAAALRFGASRMGIEVETRVLKYPEGAAEIDRLIDAADERPPAQRPDRMAELLRLATRVASSALTVVIQGETGVGKEVLARSIHHDSSRAAGPFVALNCGAFPEQLLESELFGHEKGAFTGATAQKRGLIETAEGGTLFLDEVGEMGPATQVKLLRVLEQRAFRRVGGLEDQPFDARIISATNRDLEAAVGDGSFRDDLFYRLNGITLSIPPLRERLAEIIPLAREFAAATLSAANVAKSASFTRAAEAALQAHAWPGNIRELKNAVERACVISGTNVIDIPHLPSWAQGKKQSETRLESELQNVERARIIEALEVCGGNQSRAAKLLGLSRKALIRRLDAYDIPRPRKGR